MELFSKFQNYNCSKIPLDPKLGFKLTDKLAKFLKTLIVKYFLLVFESFDSVRDYTLVQIQVFRPLESILDLIGQNLSNLKNSTFGQFVTFSWFLIKFVKITSCILK